MQYIIIPLLVLAIATLQLPLLKKITPRADLSYGIYVFGFPAQQLVANYMQLKSGYLLFVLTLSIVLPLALFSWHFVEKKCMAKKTYLFKFNKHFV